MKDRMELERGDNNLAKLLPYLSEGFCSGCKSLLEKRLKSLNLNANGIWEVPLLPNGHDSENTEEFYSASSSSSSSLWRGFSKNEYSPSIPVTSSRGQQISNGSPASITSRARSISHWDSSEPIKEFKRISISFDNGRVNQVEDGGIELSGEETEVARLSQVGRKKDFVYYENINGKQINVLQGLELHTRVFNAEEQNKIVNYVYTLQRLGQAGKLRERTYSEPRKWMRGKGRVTIQFGCCYNYAVDKNGNPPGILRDEEVDPLPSLFKSMIKRLIRWHILPPTCVPNSCIINIYDEGDCIPPHIDHHDFLRPFCTVSFLTEANILFGSNLRILGPGEFSGPIKVALPLGSVLILSGNGADVAKHCVPGVPGKRISITFRKMDDSKLPYKFLPDDHELQGLQPLVKKAPMTTKPAVKEVKKEAAEEVNESPFALGDDFPPLSMSNKPKSKRR